MSKFARGEARGGKTPTARQPLVETQTRTPDTTTHQGGPGFTRDARSELFLLAVANMVGEDTFYEKATERDNRFTVLVHEVTAQDPAWVARLIPFMRNVMNLRSAPIVAAAEYALALRNSPFPHIAETQTVPVRKVIDSAMARADEPAEFVGYWIARTGRRTLPGGVQRGVADAVTRLYTERSALKYDGQRATIRMGDVIELTHPTPKDKTQRTLFAWLLGQRHRGTDNSAPTRGLYRIVERKRLDAMPTEKRRQWLHHHMRNRAASEHNVSEALSAAGATWEWLSGWIPGGMDREAWEAVIPSMGYMALLKNLRNFDEAGVSDDVAAKVAATLADPDEVAKSRQFPFRFLSAYRAAPSLRWSWALEQALNHSLANIPALPGRTLVLVDRSGSMFWGKFSERSTMTQADAAAVFGAALALRAESADLVEFGTESQKVAFRSGESVLKVVDKFTDMGGTDIVGAVRDNFRPEHDRVVILTDEQQGRFDAALAGLDSHVPQETPVFVWNLAGYKAGFAPSGPNRHTFAGLSDKAFTMITLLEAGQSADWDTLFGNAGE